MKGSPQKAARKIFIPTHSPSAHNSKYSALLSAQEMEPKKGKAREISGEIQTLNPSTPHCLYVTDCFLGLITTAQSTATYFFDKKLIYFKKETKNSRRMLARIFICFS